MKKFRDGAAVCIGTFILLFSLIILIPAPARAAGITSATPKFKACSYLSSKVYLSWKKVKGAKKYQVFRSKTKTGKYKLFATTTKTELTKKAKGDYYYKIRAVRGKKRSRFSATRHLFGACGRMTRMYYDSRLRITYFRILVNNKTTSEMNFHSGQNQCTVFLQNKETGRMVGSCPAYLYVPGGNVKNIEPGLKKNIYVYVWGRLNRYGISGMRDSTYYYIVTTSFYARKHRFALATTNRLAESAIAPSR